MEMCARQGAAGLRVITYPIVIKQLPWVLWIAFFKMKEYLVIGGNKNTMDGCFLKERQVEFSDWPPGNAIDNTHPILRAICVP